MKLIELHILQSFPVSCLNRDDIGSPKSALFGGVKRARISSQCLKRASRLCFNELKFGNAFQTERTRLAHEVLRKKLEDQKFPNEIADKIALEFLSKLVSKEGAKKAKADKFGRVHMPALIWLSPAQINAVAVDIASSKELIVKAYENLKSKDKKEKEAAQANITKVQKSLSKEISHAGINDAPDLAIFGRMIANDASLNIEGCGMFSHAISTHKADNEIDFYTAVDDHKDLHNIEESTDADDAGAGMIGTLEYNSATYYRYIAVNLDLLASESHLGGVSEAERKDILAAFIRAALTAVPSARKNSMNASTLPHEVLGIRKPKGQPLQLVNAFEAPVHANGKGLAQASLQAMKTHLEKVESIWGEQGEKHFLTETEGGLESFIEKLLED